MSTIILNPMPCCVKGESLPDNFKRVGGNPGNLVFYESVKSQIDYDRIIDFNGGGTVSSDDNIIVPSSNFIRHVKDDPFFQRFIDFLDSTECQITLCGLGAQGTRIFDTPQKLVKYALNETQIRLFKMLSERCKSIGVRGEFTAECLEQMGIHNYRIIGCPSFFKYTDGIYPEIKGPKMNNIQVGITPGVRKIRNVVKLAENNECIWIIQSEGEYSRKVQFLGNEHISPKWAIKSYGAGALDIKGITKYFSKCSKVFWDIETWNKFYSDTDVGFAFGTRFHGNMQALRNGVPALWITHDNRTEELTKFLYLPNINIEKLSKVKTIKELFEYCDFSEIRKNYHSLCKNYAQYLNENDIENYFICN